MNNTLLSICAGVCFGVWPLLLNRTGLSGNLATFILSIIIVVFVAPFALATSSDMAKVNWPMMVLASVISGGGLLFFNNMLTRASKEEVGSLFIIVTLIQISVPMIYNIANNGLSLAKGLGFVLAMIAVLLLRS